MRTKPRAAFAAPQGIEALVTESVPQGLELATAIVTDLEQMRGSVAVTV